MKERRGVVTMKGNPVSLVGSTVGVGDKAPDAVLVANDLSVVRLSTLGGRTLILLSVPSLDTSVCSAETRRFNEIASGLGDDVAVVAISMDLPFAQRRWCGAEGVDRVRTFSDHRDASFGTSYGVLIKEARLLARAVFVVDREGIVRYEQVVKETSQEPDYGEVLAAVRELQVGKT